MGLNFSHVETGAAPHKSAAIVTADDILRHQNESVILVSLVTDSNTAGHT